MLVEGFARPPYLSSRDGRSAMRGFLLRVVIVAAGLWVASKLVPGVSITDGWSLLWAALVLGIMNAVVRPVLIIMTLPLRS